MMTYTVKLLVHIFPTHTVTSAGIEHFVYSPFFYTITKLSGSSRDVCVPISPSQQSDCRLLRNCQYSLVVIVYLKRLGSDFKCLRDMICSISVISENIEMHVKIITL